MLCVSTPHAVYAVVLAVPATLHTYVPCIPRICPPAGGRSGSVYAAYTRVEYLLTQHVSTSRCADLLVCISATHTTHARAHAYAHVVYTYTYTYC